MLVIRDDRSYTYVRTDIQHTGIPADLYEARMKLPGPMGWRRQAMAPVVERRTRSFESYAMINNCDITTQAAGLPYAGMNNW